MIVRRPAPSRLTAVLLAVLFAQALAIPGALHVVFGTPRADTVLRHTAEYFAGVSREDSWKPMRLAREYLDGAPGGPVYDELFFQGGVKFQYPPSSLLVVGRAPLPALHRISWLAVLVTAALTLVLLEQSLGAHAPEWRARGAAPIVARGAIVLGIALTCYPVVKAYTLGQIQAWLTPLVALALVLLQGGRRGSAGAVAGIVCLVKPTYAAWLLWGAARREWRFASGLAGVAAVGVLAATVAFGAVQWSAYARVLSFIGQRGETFYANQSVNGLVNRLRQNGPILEWQRDRFAPADPLVRVLTPIVFAGLVGIALLAGPRKRDLAPLDASAFLLAATAGAPIAWEHHYGVMLPIAALATGPVLAAGRTVYVVALLAALLVSGQLLAFTHATAASVANVAMSYTLFAALVLTAVLLAAGRTLDRLNGSGRET